MHGHVSVMYRLDQNLTQLHDCTVLAWYKDNIINKSGSDSISVMDMDFVFGLAKHWELKDFFVFF